LSLRLEETNESETAARLLAPAQPVRPEPGVLRIVQLASSVDSVGTQGPLLTVGPAT